VESEDLLKEKKKVYQEKIVETADIAVLVRAKVAVLLKLVAGTAVLVEAEKKILVIIIKMLGLESLGEMESPGNLVESLTLVKPEEKEILNHLVKREIIGILAENLALDPLLMEVKTNIIQNPDLVQDLVINTQVMVLVTVVEEEMIKEVFEALEMMIGVKEMKREEEDGLVQNQEKSVVLDQGKGGDLVQGPGIVNVTAVTAVAAETAKDQWIYERKPSRSLLLSRPPIQILQQQNFFAEVWRLK